MAPSLDPSSDSLKESRQELKAAFLQRHKAPHDLSISFLAGDCSFRTYERVHTEETWFAPSVVLMDAPPPHESLRPFLKVQNLLEQSGLGVPRIYAYDEEVGFMLLEDFGDTTYKRALQDCVEEPASLYKTSLDTLLSIQQISAAHLLPPFGIETLIAELESFFTWGLPSPLTRAEKEEAQSLWKAVLTPISEINCHQPALVLRDYHVDNLMVLPGQGIRSCGLLDFQDALWGTKAYDVVSILQDARLDVHERLEKEMKTYFLQHQEEPLNEEIFETAYTLLGLQRAAKILGIFLRKAKKDQNPHFLHHLPRVWRYIERGLESALTEPLKPWFRDRFPQGVPHA